MRSVALLTCVFVYTISQVYGLNPIVIKGHKFFDSVTKEQFFIKGVAYQPRGQNSKIDDPLADPLLCTRDAQLMAKLGLNVVRVYEVKNVKNHDTCMKALSDAGMYLLLDIATPKFSVNREEPEYDVSLYNAYKATVDTFSQYDNVLGFIAGNEVTNDRTNTQASAYVKAALRDIKSYIKATKKRYIPVGYASNDDEHIRLPIRDYFNCGDEGSQADFFGVNLYEWCGESSFAKSGFKDRTNEFANFSKPVFMSEYGCNLVTPRPFSEVQAIYGPEMTDVWSGGVAYEWTQENNNYGLIKAAYGNNSVELLPDYTNLQKQLAKVDPKGVNMDSFDVQRSASPCPSTNNIWKAASQLPPTPSDGACTCMHENLSCLAADLVSNRGASEQIDVMCGMVSCSEISGDAEKGKYGAFSFCSPREKLSWLYHSYAQAKGQCDFEGNAVEVAPRRKDLHSCAMIEPNKNDAGVFHETRRPSTERRKKAAATASIVTLSPLLLFLTAFIMTFSI
ncbi:Glucanosyltransferase-domain-containing protein [Radiomyces spectabilis]|uniref:Glucanosyltransferase-domain-containing protein n=1 Tax=Radiomyces spectabilis TaxID=64574 RepID=UPI0022200A49|nr:Glucanosyltransferase-domain-containing protein [Radiomyces spectabilis]KAI8366005.1 Glucanosyltransferase-domain-containing protein [Radiomyces spectabilis]